MEKARGRVVVFAPTGTETNRPCGRLSRRSWNNSASHAGRECGRRGMPLSLCRESRLTAARHGAFWVLCPSSGHNNGKKRPKALLICITYSIGYDFYAEALIPVEARFNTASPRILLLNIPNFQPTKIPEEPNTPSFLGLRGPLGRLPQAVLLRPLRGLCRCAAAVFHAIHGTATVRCQSMTDALSSRNRSPIDHDGQRANGGDRRLISACRRSSRLQPAVGRPASFAGHCARTMTPCPGTILNG